MFIVGERVAGGNAYLGATSPQLCGPGPTGGQSAPGGSARSKAEALVRKEQVRNEVRRNGASELGNRSQAGRPVASQIPDQASATERGTWPGSQSIVLLVENETGAAQTTERGSTAPPISPAETPSPSAKSIAAPPGLILCWTQFLREFHERAEKPLPNSTGDSPVDK